MLGKSQLKKLDKFIKYRKKIVLLYNMLFSGKEEISVPIEKPGFSSSWHLYPIRLKDPKKRKLVFSLLRERGIGVQVHYIPIHLQPYYQNCFGYKKCDFPVSEDYYSSCISLPIYPDIGVNKIKGIAKILLESVDGR